MLKLRHLFLAGCALLSLTPWVASAGGPPAQPYADIGGWEILYHPSTNRCSMMQTFGRGTDFYVGRDSDGSWTLAIGNPAWTSRLDAGGRYTITMILDGHDKWTDSFEARQLASGKIALFFDNVSVDFLVSVMRRNHVGIYHHRSGEHMTTLPLQNSWAAMLKLKECGDQLVPGGGQQQPAPQRRYPTERSV